MKKLFTLVALLTCFLGAKAGWEQVYQIKYSNNTAFPFYVMGYVPEWSDGIMIDNGAAYKYVEIKDDVTEDPDATIVQTQGGVKYNRYTTGGGWHQYFIADGITTEVGKNYKVVATVRASADVQMNVNMGWGWGEGQQMGTNVKITASEDFQEVEWKYSEPGGTSCNLVAQPGTTDAKIEWKEVTVYKETNAAPKYWYTIFTDDCSSATNFCKKYFKNYLAATSTDGAIVVESLEPEKTYSEYYNFTGNMPDITDADAILANDHDTQFLITLPAVLPNGAKVRFSMRCKADKEASAGTQAHRAAPVPVDGVYPIEGKENYGGTYINWQLMGDVTFPATWNTYYKEFTVTCDGMQAICFNLNKVRESINYFFDDIIVAVEMTEEDAAKITGAEPLNIPLTVDATAGYATFVPAMDVVIPEEGLKVYTATLSEDQKYVTLTPITGSIKAGTPVIVEGSTQNLEVTTGAAAASNNNLKVSDGTVKGDGKSIYVLANGNDGVGFYKLAKDASVPKGKAYLQVAAVESREFIGFAGEATGIKIVENQKKSGIIYNLAGQQVKNAKKGLYIIDGKKVIK